MENLAPQSNEYNKSLIMIDSQENFDFEKNLDDNGKQSIIVNIFMFIVIVIIIIISLC